VCFDTTILWFGNAQKEQVSKKTKTKATDVSMPNRFCQHFQWRVKIDGVAAVVGEVPYFRI